MRYLKYRFPDWEAMEAKIKTEQGYDNCHVAVLGDSSLIGLVLQEGDPMPEPTGLIAVDILWTEGEHPDFTEFQVWPEPSGHHSFAGLGHLYEQEYNNR